MLINCIIVEDEPLALKRTSEFVNQVSYLNLLSSFSNAFDAIGFLKTNKVDLIFLDIEMDGFTGIEFIESLTCKPRIIITTAYDKYALKGFELNVDDYLLKPFRFDRFLNAVERVYDILSKDEKEEKNFIFVKTEYRLERITFSDIVFIEGMGDYRNVQTATKKILTLQTFSDFEKELPANKFCRVHKSFIVSIDKIISIERNRIKIGDNLIPISNSYKERLYNLIGIRNNGNG
jgi:two-component system, LytTR family, response regulator